MLKNLKTIEVVIITITATCVILYLAKSINEKIQNSLDEQQAQQQHEEKMQQAQQHHEESLQHDADEREKQRQHDADEREKQRQHELQLEQLRQGKE